jgi:hypothetical protein
MQSVPLETVVLPSKAVMVVDGPCPHPDWCMYNAYTGVKYYLYYTQQCGKDSRFALPAVEKTTFQGKLAEDAWRALEWTTVLRSATLFSSNTFALDEISRGIRHAFETWTVPIWVTFGMQTLLDIQDVFDTSIDQAYTDLRARVQYASKMLAKDLDFRRPFRHWAMRKRTQTEQRQY